MKTITAIFLCLAALTACGGTDQNSPTNQARTEWDAMTTEAQQVACDLYERLWASNPEMFLDSMSQNGTSRPLAQQKLDIVEEEC